MSATPSEYRATSPTAKDRPTFISLQIPMIFPDGDGSDALPIALDQASALQPVCRSETSVVAQVRTMRQNHVRLGRSAPPRLRRRA